VTHFPGLGRLPAKGGGEGEKGGAFQFSRALHAQKILSGGHFHELESVSTGQEMVYRGELDRMLEEDEEEEEEDGQELPPLEPHAAGGRRRQGVNARADAGKWVNE